MNLNRQHFLGLAIAFVLFPLSLLGQDQGTGLIFLSEQEYKSIPLASSAMMGTLPEQKDLSEWFPKPGDQGFQASCVAWAVCYGLKSYQEAVENKRYPNNLKDLFSPSYIYNQIKLNGCDNGSYIRSALELLKKEGVATLEQFPYDQSECNRQPTKIDKTNARRFSIADWRTVSLQDEIDVKSHIASGFPVVIGMMIDEGFRRIIGNQIYSGPSGKELGGHAMVVVGYNDKVQAFKILNSWSANWGDDGYVWVSYRAFKQRVKEAYAVQDIIITDPTEIKPVIDNKPIIEDIPTPAPSSKIAAKLNGLVITHNVPVNMPLGQFPGMVITVPGRIINAQGSNAQIIIRFIMPNGQPLVANFQETFFRDIHGYVAVGSPVLPVFNNSADTGNATFAIPYYALNLNPTNGFQTYELDAVATIYINGFEYNKSPNTKMLVKY
jgi:hypothetical protein